MKLFLKIFLWFLAAIALMVGVIIFVTRTFQTDPMFSRWQRSAQSNLVFWSKTSARLGDKGGDADLKEFLGRLQETRAIRDIKVIGTDGLVWFGDEANVRDFDALAARTVSSGEPEIDVNTTDTAMGAAPIVFADGRRSVLLIRWEPPRAPSLFFDSWLGYLRLIGLLLTAFVVCFALARYLSSPIGKIRTATQKLADGDLSTRVADQVGRRRDEMSDLAHDFDVMAERIETLVTSQRRLNSDISHELRSPLARMNVALEIAKQKSNPETQPILDRIETESHRLNEMISRLLILAKLETGSEMVEPVRVDLTEIVRDVAEDADFEAQAKGRSVKISSDEACSVMGSENLLRSAIENVLRNAVRYTAEGTAVDVALTSNNGNAVLQVSDHGGGVPEDELANLFRPFYRVGEARERKTGGTGLGLAIAERAIKAHKGTIAARNTGEGLMVEICLKKETAAGD